MILNSLHHLLTLHASWLPFLPLRQGQVTKDPSKGSFQYGDRFREPASDEGRALKDEGQIQGPLAPFFLLTPPSSK